jgi:hypothetical protein
MLSVGSLGLVHPGDAHALEGLREAGALWRAAGPFLNAGFAMSQAVRAAWGTEALEEVSRQAMANALRTLAATYI